VAARSSSFSLCAVSPHRELVTLFGIAEPLSCLTHALSALALLALGPALVRRGGGGARSVALALYVAAVAFMFLASATYHALPFAHPARDLFWHLDHASIWIGLAASFAAVRVVYLEGRFVPVVAVLWSIAIVGVSSEMTALRELPAWISPALYIFMGWCGLPTVLLVRRERGAEEAWPLLWSGVVVTVGGFMDVFQWPHVAPGLVEAHELLHLTTLVGGAVYFRGLWRAAGRWAPPPCAAPSREIDAAAPA
jgi:hemolysin III